MVFESLEEVFELGLLVVGETRKGLMLKPIALLAHVCGTYLAVLRELYEQLPPVVWVGLAANKPSALELGQYLTERGGTYVRALEELTLRELAAALVHGGEHELLSASSARMHVEIMAKEPEVMQDRSRHAFLQFVRCRINSMPLSIFVKYLTIDGWDTRTKGGMVQAPALCARSGYPIGFAENCANV